MKNIIEGIMLLFYSIYLIDLSESMNLFLNCYLNLGELESGDSVNFLGCSSKHFDNRHRYLRWQNGK